MFGLTLDLATVVNVVWAMLVGGLVTWGVSYSALKRLTRHHEELHASFEVLAQSLVRLQKHPGSVGFRLEDGRLKGTFHYMVGESEGTSEDTATLTIPERPEDIGP